MRLTKAQQRHVNMLHGQDLAAEKYPHSYTAGRSIGYGFKRQTAMALLDRGLVDVRRNGCFTDFHLTATGRALVTPGFTPTY